MVKKRSFANKTVAGSSSSSSSTTTTLDIKPEDRKTLEDDLNLLDHSIIREPINVGIKNVHQIITCISDGTKEIKDLILNECNIIYECRVCRNLFRSLANFLAHKRLYCKKHCCEQMVLFDQNWFTEKQDNFIKPETYSVDSELKSKIITPSDKNSNNDQELKSNKNFVNVTTCDKKDCLDDKIRKRSADNTSLITTQQRIVKKKRIENLVSKLNPPATTSIPIIDSSMNSEITKNDKSDTAEDNLDIKTIVKNTKSDSEKQIENEFASFYKTTFAVKIDFVCEYCDASCTYLSSAIRHLMNSHSMSRISAKKFVLDYGKKHGISIKEDINDDCCRQNTEDESIIESEIKIEDPVDCFEPIQAANCPSPKENLNSQNVTTDYDIPESNENQTTPKNKRYETRCSIRKKCFYNCNSQSCFFSKHCPKTTNNDQSIQYNQNHISNKEIDSEIKNGDQPKDNEMVDDQLQSSSSSTSNSTMVDLLSISVKKRSQNVIKKKKLKKIKESVPILRNIETKDCDNNELESQQETAKLNFKPFNPTSTIISSSLSSSSSSSSFGENNSEYHSISDGFENFHNSSEDSSLSNLQNNNNNNNVDSLEFDLQKIQSQDDVIRAKIFDHEIEPVVESTHSPLVTKLSLRKFDHDHSHHKSTFKEFFILFDINSFAIYFL